MVRSVVTYLEFHDANVSYEILSCLINSLRGAMKLQLEVLLMQTIYASRL